MTTVNVIEDSNNPAKYLIISTQSASSEAPLSTRVAISSNNQIDVIEISKIKGDQGEKGDKGDIGPPGKDGVQFDILPINSGGTNNNTYIANKIIYYDGSQITSSNIDINNIQTDIISNIYVGTGLSKTQNGNIVTLNTNIGNGLSTNNNSIIIDDNIVLTRYNFNLSDNFIGGKLGIPYGGTNNTFFSQDSFVYYDGEKLNSYPLSTGAIVHSGQSISIVAGSGLTGGGSVSLPNGSIVIGLQNSSDITVLDNSIELSTIMNSGIYSKVQVDQKGRVVAGSNITLNDLVSYLGFVPWHSGNDGSGSGLDADLLDGQQGSFYRDGSNITGTISNSILPEQIAPGSAPKVTFNSKGIIIDSGILNYLDITNGLGYIPFDKHGGQILGDTEIFGNLLADSGLFESNNITIGSDTLTADIRGIRFRYNDNPIKYAILGYSPFEQVFRLYGESASGRIITEEKADTKYVGITGYQEISGIKTFLNNINVYGRVIIRSQYSNLSPIDVGTNNILVQYLNADLLDGEHGYYYRNAANLTGILNEYVVIPHIEDRATVFYSEDEQGALEYLPKFHRPSSGHPMVLKDSLIYETGFALYMDQASVSVGINYIDPITTHSLLVGTSNTSTDTALNSMAVGQNNIVSGINSIALNSNNIANSNNSIALGTHAETWLNDQIAIGGFIHNKVGLNNTTIKDAHGQVSYVPLKYHGMAPGWVNILNFKIPDNKTLEYSADLLFTKQKETGVASFTITTGIVKNYGYRDPARGYAPFKKSIMVVNHGKGELYNNSQERTYGLNIEATNILDKQLIQNSLKITAPPLQYESLGIENYGDPIIVESKSDHQLMLNATRGNILNNYRSEYVIKLDPFSGYPYNNGALINMGSNLGVLTECLFYRLSGEKEIYIKFPNHGISPQCPLSSDIYIGNPQIKQFVRKDYNFDFAIPKELSNIKISQTTHLPIKNNSNTTIFRHYLHKNIVGSISGYANFDIYETTGSLSYVGNKNIPRVTGLNSLAGRNTTWDSLKYRSIFFNYSGTSPLLSHKDYSNIDNAQIPIIIDLQNPTDLSGFDNLAISGYLNPTLGYLDFIVNKTNPIYINDTKIYYIGDLSFNSYTYPYIYNKRYTDSFEIIDQNTISLVESQLGFVTDNILSLTLYPNNLKNKINFNYKPITTSLELKINSILLINNIQTKVTGININNLETTYSLDYNFGPTKTLHNIIDISPISGLGYSNYRSFVLTTGSYSIDKNNNSTYTKNFNQSIANPLVSTCPAPDFCLVPTGNIFNYSLNSSYNDSIKYSGGIHTNIVPYTKVAISSIIIDSSNQNYINLPELQIVPSVVLQDLGDIKYINSDFFDFRLNNVNLFSSTTPVVFSGYNSTMPTGNYILSSGSNTKLYVNQNFYLDDVVSYKVVTTVPDIIDHDILDMFSPNKNNPTFGEHPKQITRSTNWLLGPTQWRGTVDVLNDSLGFSLKPTGIIILPQHTSNFSSNNAISGSTYTLATGFIIIEPDNIVAWSNAGLYNHSGMCHINIADNIAYSNAANFLNQDNILDSAILIGAGSGLSRSFIYETLQLNINSVNNTGIFAVNIYAKQPYQTISINLNENSEYLRFISSSSTTGLHNNFNIGFNISGIASGIIPIDNQSNRYAIDDPYSKVYNVNSNSLTFAIRSGVFPTGIYNGGDILLNFPKIYELYPKNELYARNNQQNTIFGFQDKYSILQSGIYPIEKLQDHSIYLYDFSKNFLESGTFGTGTIYFNKTSYNITDSKFSLWGRNFDGDIIQYPYRDIPVFVQDLPGQCATGYLCLKISGIPDYIRSGDKFWLDIKPLILEQSSDYISCTGDIIGGTNIIYAPDAIYSGITIGMNVFNSAYYLSTPYITAFSGLNKQYLIVNQNSTYTNNSTNIQFNKETFSQQNSTANLRNIFRNDLMGPYTIYKDKISLGVVSVLSPIPGYFFDVNHPLYAEWNSPQATRGINIWRSSGNLCVAIMITGYENIQTDKDPNYGYKFMDLTHNLSQSGIYNYKQSNSGLIISNHQSTYHYDFNDSLNKYLSTSTLSGLYKPTKASGIIGANIRLDNASTWSVNETTGIKTDILVRDIDPIRILGIDAIYNNNHIPLSRSNDNIFIANGLPQNSGIKFRIGVNGGAGIPQEIPFVTWTGINNITSHTGYHVYGLAEPTGYGVSNNSYKIGPFSNTWYIEIENSGLNNIPSFTYYIKDILDNSISGEIKNANPLPLSPQIINLTDHIYYETNSSPWVISFDVENIPSIASIGISGSSTSNTSIISSGISYTSGVNKWQGYLVGHSTITNSTGLLNFAITGDYYLFNSSIISLTGSPGIYTPKITNAPSLTTLKNDVGANVVSFYFNYQKPRPYTDDSANISLLNIPSGAIISYSKIPTDYQQITNRDLYRVNITNIGPTGYNALLSVAYGESTNNTTIPIIVYNNFAITNVSIPEPTKFVGENWLFSFNVIGGGGHLYAPNIKLFNPPSNYLVNKTYNHNIAAWNISIVGERDSLNRYNQVTGVYDIGIYAYDVTSVTRDSARITYVCPVEIKNIKPIYGIKNKSYFMNIDFNNGCKNTFDPNYTVPSINNFFPSQQTLIYDKYNPFININEVRYSGSPLTEKWDTRLQISNIGEEFFDIETDTSRLYIDIKGIETDVLSVIGLLKLKELDVIGTDYPPLQIIDVQPENIKEYNQGDDWELTFSVIGGLGNINYPPTIILSGLPSICSGYYPDENPSGPQCLSAKSFNTVLQKWNFGFTGYPNCVTGLYPISIKAFDITGEDTEITSYFYKPLINPGPTLQEEIDPSLYPNCQFSSGIIKYGSPYRGLPCIYQTGISGVSIIGNIPPGLILTDKGGLDINGLGTGILEITGIPTVFPENNIYDPFIVEVTDKTGKKTRKTITYNTAGIAPLTRNPLGATIFFPNSGYFTPKIQQGNKKYVQPTQQTVYEPYPSTGLFDCRSTLSVNQCPVPITGSYLAQGTGVSVSFGSTAIVQNNIFAVFNNNLLNPYNGFYSLINITSNTVFDSETQSFVSKNSGVITRLGDTSAFVGLSPISGRVDIVPIQVVNKYLLGGIMLNANPSPNISCTTCLLGDGLYDGEHLVGKMRPSILASITGSTYPIQQYNSSNKFLPGGPQNIDILDGVVLEKLSTSPIKEVSSICFSNCYESGAIYLSGVVVPSPTLDITDLADLEQGTYNGQVLALATRCAFGSGPNRGLQANYRSVNIKYTLKNMMSGTPTYYNRDNGTFSQTKIEYSIDTSPSPTDPRSIPLSAPIVSSGIIMELFMERSADAFPTYDPNSYDYMSNYIYWIHKGSNQNDPITNTTYPPIMPIRFGSGLVITNGTPFSISGQVLGGDITTNYQPSINTYFATTGLNTPSLDINNNFHNINMTILGPVIKNNNIINGLWDVAITGQIIGLTGSYLLNYDLDVTITENISANYPKVSNSRIPITIINPMSLVIPEINNQQNTDTLFVNYGSKWVIDFTISGGNRPPRYYTDLQQWLIDNQPIIEINGQICNYDTLIMSYNFNNNEWAVKIRSKNIILENTNVEMVVMDKMFNQTKNFNVVVLI